MRGVKMEKIDEAGVKLYMDGLGPAGIYVEAEPAPGWPGKFHVYVKIARKRYLVKTFVGQTKIFSPAAVIQFANKFSANDVVFRYVPEQE